MGLNLNIKKTETMVMSKKKDPPICAIRIGNKSLKQEHNFKYLGTWISADGKCKAEVTARIMQTKKRSSVAFFYDSYYKVISDLLL